MQHAKPLPTDFVSRYVNWKTNQLPGKSDRLRDLADNGQHPKALVISCCDSRVMATDLFGAEQGDFFMHRNIASLVPPYQIGDGYHGTSAAIEYAVTALKVPHIMIIGHSLCGGVQGCADMCAGRAPQLKEASSFVGRWMDILAPKYEKVAHLDGREQSFALEQEAVLTSLENLMTFPFVADRVTTGNLELHGLWVDIGDGTLQSYDADTKTFVAV